MKKLKKAVSLLMMSAMLVLPTAVSVGAEDVDNYTKDNVVSVATTRAYSYTSPATITGSNVRLRSQPNLNASVLLYLQQGYSVHVDKNNAIQSSDGTWWYPCQYGSTYGFVAAQYVHIIPT